MSDTATLHSKTPPPQRVAVIGAGTAGLAAARMLRQAGCEVVVFEKSRGPGGRAATRRHGDIGFDHGAQYFTARDAAFQQAVAAWRAAGVVAPWPARIGRVENGVITPSPDGSERLVAVPGMNALGKHLAAGLDLRRMTRVAPPQPGSGRWHLVDEQGEALGDFDALVVAAPAPQAAALLQDCAPQLAATAATVDYDPTWAVMLEVEADDPLGLDGLFAKDPPFSWIARNHAKPGRAGHAWVAHASPAWTRENLEMPVTEAAGHLGSAFAALLGIPERQISVLGAHRWLYSLVPSPLDVGALWDPERQLAVCGDWCQGARIEGAWRSGVAAAGRLLGSSIDASF